MSSIEKLVEAFERGDELTAKQITARYGLENPRAAITHIRQEKGLPIYANPIGEGRIVRYRLGTPSRKLVAAGYKAIACGVA